MAQTSGLNHCQNHENDVFCGTINGSDVNSIAFLCPEPFTLHLRFNNMISTLYQVISKIERVQNEFQRLNEYKINFYVI